MQSTRFERNAKIRHRKASSDPAARRARVGLDLVDEAAQDAVHRACWRSQFLGRLRTGRAAVGRASTTENPPR